MMRKLMRGLQPWPVERPAAVGSLDDDYTLYHYIGRYERRSSARAKKIARVWKSRCERALFGVAIERPGRLPPRPSGPQGSSLRVVPAGLRPAGRSGWVWVRWMAGRRARAGDLTPGRTLADRE